MNLFHALYRYGPLMLRGIWQATPFPRLVIPSPALAQVMREWRELMGYALIDIMIIMAVASLLASGL
jgi:hypothetical protein